MGFRASAFYSSTAVPLAVAEHSADSFEKILADREHDDGTGEFRDPLLVAEPLADHFPGRIRQRSSVDVDVHRPGSVVTMTTSSRYIPYLPAPVSRLARGTTTGLRY
jgi:hypothetical protein